MMAESSAKKHSPLESGFEFEEGLFMVKERKSRKRRSRGSRGARRWYHAWDERPDDEQDAAVLDAASDAIDGPDVGRDPGRAIRERLEKLDDSLLTEEERLYRNARRRANQRVALTRATVRAGLITVPLLIFIPFAGFIALLYFGVDLGRRAFRLLYEPRLRERYLQEEVQRQVVTRVRSERQNLEGEHHRSLEHLSASIAHEIRNPITAAKSLIQQISEDPQSEDRDEYARVAVGELERVERSISHLLRFAREEDRRTQSILMEDVLESAIETFRDRCARRGFEIERQYDIPGQLEADPEQLRRVVINLISNALDAIEAAGIEAPEIRVAMGENLAGTEIWLRIRDNGLGMDDETRARIFDPFYTSRKKEGTGLGLALCRKIVDEHGGRIEVDSEPGEGTEFVLSLPKGGAA
jgi:two-component system sensor histidine kinase HydH